MDMDDICKSAMIDSLVAPASWNGSAYIKGPTEMNNCITDIQFRSDRKVGKLLTDQ